jgi:hypothetical protein
MEAQEMKRYKLVTQDYRTRAGESNETHWEIGKTIKVRGEGNELCTDGVLHSYATPLLAVLLNPIHAEIENPRLLEVKGSPIVARDWGKAGHKEITPIAELALPVVTTVQRAAFALLCALRVYKEPSFVAWAQGWLRGKDRTQKTANAAYATTADAYATTADVAARAANAAARAANAAARAANAAKAAARAADAAARAARAADAAARASIKIDFARLARKAMSYKESLA